MSEHQMDLDKRRRDWDLKLCTLAGRLSGTLGNIAHRLTWSAEFADETDDRSMEVIARMLREMGEEFTDMFGSSTMDRIIWDRDSKRFTTIDECALCPADADGTRDNGLCQACDIAEHGEGMDDVLEHLHSEVEL